jgi:hypothetical protein
VAAVIGATLFFVGLAIGLASRSTKTNTVAGPTVRRTVTVHRVRTKVRTKVITRAAPAPPPAPPPPAPPPAPPPPATAADKDFAVQTLQLQDDGLGDIGGIARITNTSSRTLSGSFTFTFFQGGHIVGTAIGVANDVAGGQTVTVDLSSQDPIFSGSFRYQFQVDTEF